MAESTVEQTNESAEILKVLKEIDGSMTRIMAVVAIIMVKMLFFP